VPREIEGEPDFVTPTLKLRRARIEAAFNDIVEHLYR
jgi:hypothetical protein